MAYLTDTEKRILFSALAREEKVCKTMDRLEEPKGTPLVKIVESLRRKFYYDRFEKEIRAKAIDEVFNFLKTQRDRKSMKVNFDDLEIKKYKEQLKGNEFFNFDSPVVRIDEKSYNKAIDDFVEKITLEISESIIWDMLATMSENGSLSDTSDKIVEYVIDTAKRIAEQLKGVRNE